MRNIWEYLGSDPEALAQLAHVGWGAALTFAFSLWLSPAISMACVFGFALAKELAEYWTESSGTRGSTFWDLVFWVVGIAIAFLLMVISVVTGAN